MNFNLKLLAASMAAMALAAPAQADIATAVTGNGGMFVSVWADMGTPDDNLDDLSFTYDLNIGLNTFLSTLAVVQPGGLVAQSFDLGPVFDSYMAQATGLVEWTVSAGDSFGLDSVLTTVEMPNPNNTINQTFRNWATTGVDTYLANVNALLDDSTDAVITDAANGAAQAVLFNDNFGTRATGWDMGGVLGQSLDFWWMAENGTLAVTPIKKGQFLDANGNPFTWTLEGDGTLIYAAVPEAETYALMLAGLGVVGLMARRRRAA
jgi:hypothetical protein